MIRAILGNVGCLSEDTKIKIKDKGKIRNISLKSLPKRFDIITKDIRKGIREFASAQKVSTGIKDVFRIHFSDGDKVDATLDHRFFTPDGKEITVGELVNYNISNRHGEGMKKRIQLASDKRGILNENHFYNKKHTMMTRTRLHKINFKTGIRAYHRPFMRSKLPKYCQDCGNKSKRTIVHHKNEIRTDNRMKNLKILCWKCHSKYHHWGRHK